MDGEAYMLEEYYPEFFPKLSGQNCNTWQASVTDVVGLVGIPGIITGVGLAYCGYCGTALVAQNMMNRRRADGSLADGHRRMQCTSYSKNGGCSASSGWRRAD